MTDNTTTNHEESPEEVSRLSNIPKVVKSTDKSSKRSYKPSDYTEGGDLCGSAKHPHEEVVFYFFARRYELHGLNGVIPPTHFSRYYKSAKDMITRFGGVDEAKAFVDWVLCSDDDFLRNNGYSHSVVFCDATYTKFDAYAGGLVDTRPKRTRKHVKGLGTRGDPNSKSSRH